MARVGLNISGRDLAVTAKVGYATIARFETGSNITEANRDAIKRALEAAGARFHDDTGTGHLGVSIPVEMPAVG